MVRALTLCNHFHASVAGALPGQWHSANSWHDRRCRSGEWNKLPSFSLSATSSGEHRWTLHDWNCNKSVTLENNDSPESQYSNRRRKTEKPCFSYFNLKSLQHEQQTITVQSFCAWYALRSSTRQIELQAHVEDKASRVGLVQPGQQQSPDFSMLALIHPVTHLFRKEQRKKHKELQAKIQNNKNEISKQWNALCNEWLGPQLESISSISQ